MSLFVVHGEKVAASRLKLTELIEQAQKNGQEIGRLENKNITLPNLEQALSGQSLFGSPTTLVVEGLFSLPHSKARTQLIDFIASHTGESSIIIWDKKSLTKTQLKTLHPTQDFEFKPSPVLFQWLDAFSPLSGTKKRQLELLHQAIQTESAEFCAIMLARQIRLLIQAKTGVSLKGAPFMIAKLKKQSNSFSLEQLLALHTQLLELDLKTKTGNSAWNVAGELDLLTLRM